MNDETRDDEDRAAPAPDEDAAGQQAPAPDEDAAGRQAPTDEEAEPAPNEDAEPVAAGATEPAPDEDPSAGLRLLGALVTLPWVVLYGATGVWAVTLAARGASQGLKQIDAGYTRYVTPAELAFVGALLLAAFAVMLGCGLLLLFRSRSMAAWLTLLLVAAGLTGGAVWAAIRGHLHPLLWVLLFFGLVYVTVVALVKSLQMTRAGRRGTIAPP